MLERMAGALAVVLALLVAWPAAAQEAVPRIEDAELVFQQGLEAFEEGDYGMAYRRFRLLYDSYALNRKTTAAYLMAGKALYREGRYQDAADLLTDFVRRFPTSGYVDEARQVAAYAAQQIERTGEEARTVDLGILLPMNGDDAVLSQALFNGIRLAVDEHNRVNAQGPRVRMVFRNSGGTAGAAAGAVRELVEAGADVLIGPLYSDEARAAAEAAERAGVVLVAPLATDEDVSEGRPFVFQANPTITMRGRQMARFAMRSLRLGRFGVVAERDAESISERMGEGFQQEVMYQGGALDFYRLLEGTRGWSQLPQVVGADTVARVEAVYLPVAGGRADALAEAALVGLDRMGASVRVLGNAEWHDLPNKRLASQFQATYTNDFYVDPARDDVQAFRRDYRTLAGSEPDAGATRGRLAYTGYDLARFVLGQATRDPGQPLHEALRAAPLYQGLGLRIDFGEGNVNEALYYFRYRDGRAELIQ